MAYEPSWQLALLLPISMLLFVYFDFKYFEAAKPISSSSEGQALGLISRSFEVIDKGDGCLLVCSWVKFLMVFDMVLQDMHRHLDFIGVFYPDYISRCALQFSLSHFYIEKEKKKAAVQCQAEFVSHSRSRQLLILHQLLAPQRIFE